MIDVNHDEHAREFQVHLDGATAIAAYERQDPAIIVFTHTEVPPVFQGRGVGNALAQAALEYARSEQLRVVPACRFIRGYIERHPEFQDLVQR